MPKKNDRIYVCVGLRQENSEANNKQYIYLLRITRSKDIPIRKYSLSLVFASVCLRVIFTLPTFQLGIQHTDGGPRLGGILQHGCAQSLSYDEDEPFLSKGPA